MEELINKYFEKSLTAKQLIEFNQKLETDAEFKADFDFQKSVKSAVRSKERAEIKNLVASFEKPKQQNGWWKYAAAALVVIVGGWVVFQQFLSKPNPSELYLSYYQTYPNIIAPNVRGENQEGIKNQAFKAYDAEKYMEAIRLFSEIKNEDYSVFYTAVCYLELNESQKALQIFESEKFSNSPYPFETYRKWYLALVYLKTNQIESGKKILEELSKTENPQKEKAKELLGNW